MRSARLLAVTVLAVVLAMAMTGPAHATVTTITPSSADTYLYEAADTYNFGSLPHMDVLADSQHLDRERILVKFDLSSIPSGSTISTASLQLYHFGNINGNPVGRTYTANRVTTDWVEGTCVSPCSPSTGGATWNTVDGTTNWGTPGGDFTVTGAASSTVADITSAPVYMTWDVTTIVKAWIEGGQPNYGFLIKDLNEGSIYGAVFASREQGSNMPILTVDYAAPVHPFTPVGGIVVPVDTIAVLAPWMAVIGLVGCISTVVVVAKKRRA
jgi:hypothetical protein